MDLDEWFWRTKTPKRDMAEAIGVHVQTVFAMTRKEHTPSLFTCVAIQKYTKGRVGLEDLLNEADLKKLKMIKGCSVSIEEPIQN